MTTQKASRGDVGLPIVIQWIRALATGATLTVELVKPSGATATLAATQHPEASSWWLAYTVAGTLDEVGTYTARGREVVTGTSDLRSLPVTFEVV